MLFGSGEIEWHVTMRLLRSKDLCFSLVVARLLLTKLLFLALVNLSRGGVCQTRAIFGNADYVIYGRSRPPHQPSRTPLP